MSSIWDWSTTPATNASADADVNWSEGQAPSTVNDSARQMMKRIAQLLLDIGGSPTSGGAANAQTVSTSSPFTTYATGQIIGFKAGYTNTALLTLNANGIGAKKVYANGAVTAGGEVKADGIFLAVYDAALDTAAGGWRLINPQGGAVAAITSGVIDGATIGGTTPAAGTFTDLKSNETFTLNGDISPTSLSTDQNDYTPTDGENAAVLRLTSSAAVSITGLVAGNVDGAIKILTNIGSNAITLANASTSSTAANRVAFLADIVIPGGGSLILRYDGTTSRWNDLTTALVAATPAATDTSKRVANAAFVASSIPTSGYKNLVVAYATAATVTITADLLMLEDASGNALLLRSVSLTADVSASGANGLDTGTEAINTGYHVWVIYNPTTSTRASLLSTSSTSPTMPSGYTYKRRVSYVFNNPSSNFRQFSQVDDYSALASGIARSLVTGSAGTYSTTAPTWATATPAGLIPSTAYVVDVAVGNKYNGGAAVNVIVANVSTAVGAESTGGTAIRPLAFVSSGNSNIISARIPMVENQIYWASSGAAGHIDLIGYVDNI